MNDIDALAGLNSAINNLTAVTASTKSQKRQHKNNKELLEIEKEWQLKLWELAKEYNRPVNEVARLLEAGINPALAFSNGGASAPPVPTVPEAGASTAPMPNLTNPALAAQQSSVVSSQVELNQAAADKQRAEAEAARESAGLTETRNRYETVMADAVEANRAVFKLLPRLEALTKEFEAHLKGNDVKRSDIYTNSFEERNSLQISRMRLDNDVLRADYNRIVQLTDLYKAQGRLTDAQANKVLLQNDLLFVERYYARWNYQMARIINRRVYGDPDKPNSYSFAVNDLTLAARNEAANALARSGVERVSLSNQFRFETEYGFGARIYSGYELPRRQVNKLRTDQYTDVVNTIAGAGMSVVSAGATRSLMRYRDAAAEAFRRTSREFGVNSPVSPYLGGSEYYPFDDF